LQQGLDDTISTLDKAKIASFGYDKTAIVANVGLIGANALGTVEQGVDMDQLKNTLANQIKTLKQQVPIVVVGFHWGTEGNYGVDDIQKDLGYFAIDQGADLVIGNHPHVLEPTEQYKGKTIVYSLGNFAFGGNTRLSDQDTAIFQQTFRFMNGRMVEIGEGKLIPCLASGSKDHNDYRPVPRK
jgi:poly-gamma-glutamate capsule biosynthesis protein CapA/YwtB (metallophosphatase superfamily)